MHLRKVLTTAAAIAAASILTLAPTAAYAAISTIEVDGLTSPNGDVNYVGVMKSASATYAGYSPGCVSGAASGVVKRGTGGLAPNPAFSFNAISLNCGSPLGTVTMNLTCPVDVVMSGTNTVNVGKTDTAVTGVAGFTNGAGTDCLRISFVAAGCTIDVGGNVAASFDETVTTVGGIDYQDLSLSGGGLSTKNATGICGAFIPNNSAMTVSAVFAVHVQGTTTGVVDFQ